MGGSPRVAAPTGRGRESTARLRNRQRSWCWNRNWTGWLALTRTAILPADDAQRRRCCSRGYAKCNAW